MADSTIRLRSLQNRRLFYSFEIKQTENHRNSVFFFVLFEQLTQSVPLRQK